MMTQKEKHFERKEKVLGQFFTPPEVAKFIVSFSKRILHVIPHAVRGYFFDILRKKDLRSMGLILIRLSKR